MCGSDLSVKHNKVVRSKNSFNIDSHDEPGTLSHVYIIAVAYILLVYHVLMTHSHC